ncbi:acyl-CoA dehydrogenase [Albimonas sp. CAU 1670]|uniref:acyl-CoA dehydrogenase n=1 Tax=Albimonas sp. CAU 1670 TaxID=3032599 RepID=UPI0023DB2A38|nr:acyl-CoA dehydrogenase [Albimonas sp. CAU 1670]MDF2231285.1 acyl-CoA dehydrogenase [Albimonas sp. CAU 1670]
MRHVLPLPSIRVDRCASILVELRDGAWLAPESWATPEALHAALRQVAARDLSAGRLLEGHANAHRLIRAHGAPAQLSEAKAAMREGALYGVWAADGPDPVSWNGETLDGAKRFASGLGMAARAIVAARRPDGEGAQLVIVDASDMRRHRPEEWDVSGMADSCSGGFDCTGLPGELLGAPGVYTAEPQFIGGTWRIASVTLGGVIGLLERARTALARRGHLSADAQLLRLAPLGIRALAADAAVARAAEVAEGPLGRAEPERAATLSISCRLLMEELGQDAIAAVERSVGLGMFALDDPVGRMARDLACYLRQAARDAMTLRVGRDLFVESRTVEDWFDA